MFVPNAAMRGRGRRGGGADPWFLVMAYQLWQQIERLGPNKPRVTLACMALAAALHFNLLGDVGDAFLGASSADACVSAHRVLSRREWWRLLASPLRFADDLNLVVNLTSFLHKGHVLERARGPEGFARLLPILLLATNLAYVAVAHLAHRLRLFDARRVCLVGTTALNFALGAVADADRTATGTTTRVWGIAVPTRWASWAELGVVHLLNPHLAGLVYHACGVVAGATLVAVERRAETRRERKTGTPRAEENREGPTVAAVMGEVTATITAAVTVEPRAGERTAVLSASRTAVLSSSLLVGAFATVFSVAAAPPPRSAPSPTFRRARAWFFRVFARRA